MRIDRRQVDLSEALNDRGLGTLLFDLVDEADSAEVEGNVGSLAARLIKCERGALFGQLHDLPVAVTSGRPALAQATAKTASGDA
jgi:hypothetical protein